MRDFRPGSQAPDWTHVAASPELDNLKQRLATALRESLREGHLTDAAALVCLECFRVGLKWRRVLDPNDADELESGFHSWLLEGERWRALAAHNNPSVVIVGRVSSIRSTLDRSDERRRGRELVHECRLRRARGDDIDDLLLLLCEAPITEEDVWK